MNAVDGTSDELKLRLLERTQKMLEADVDQVMTSNLVMCEYDSLAAEAVRLILEKKVFGILVTKAGAPHSMITTYDLLRLSYEEVFDPARDYLRMTVGQVVADKPMVSVESGSLLRDALNIMIDQKVRTIPVVKEGRVLGVVSMQDMIQWYRDTHDEVRTGKL